MKKALTILAGALLVPFLCSQALAQDVAEAKSVNAVGVVKYTVPANGALACISLPLHSMENVDWVWGKSSLADQLDRGSTVYFWDETGWASASKSTRTGAWQPAAATNHQFVAGEAFFIQGPSGAEEKTISLLGELPVETNLTYTLTGNMNLDTRCVSRYPVTTVFGESELADALTNGSTVYFWENGWASASKSTRTGAWQPATVLTRPIAVGEGIFVQSAGSASVVTNSRPFDWN